MRIIIITQGISKIIEPILKSDNEVIGIIESAPRKKPPSIINIKNKIILTVYALLSSKPMLLRDFARKNNIPYYYFKKGDNEGIENWVKMKAPDLIVVHSMSQLLRENILSIPKHGAINLHPSYLPEYRGPNPLFWMYHDQVLNLGVTVHHIDKGEDTGDIIYQERYEINTGDTLSICYEKLYPIGIRLILKAIEEISKGTSPRLIQPKESPTLRARNIIPEEYKELIDWDKWDVERVYHFLQGTPQYHNYLLNGSRFHRLGKDIKIINFQKCIVPKSNVGKMRQDNDFYYLICSNGKICIEYSLNILTMVKKIIL